jgi:hypothetical protein
MDGIAWAASAMSAAQARLEIAVQNLANSSSDGFRKSLARGWMQARGVRVVPPDDELETPSLLREHPRWVKDALAISQRARRLFTGLRPSAIVVFGFWDHATRGITVAGRGLGVDSSGSYYAVQ